MADAPLLLRRPGKPWRKPDLLPYENERGLQDLLIETPTLIRGVSTPAAVVDEFWIAGVGSADVVVVEADGTITIVECKLRTNAEIRRTVIGQVLAYAAGTWRTSYEGFSSQFASRAGQPLLEAVRSAAEAAGFEFDAGEFRSGVERALEHGAFRLCVAVDEVTDELRSIVEFLNTKTAPGFELLLLELGIVTDGNTEVLIPQVYGSESARMKEQQPSSSSIQWSHDELFKALADTCTPAGVEAVRALYDYAVSRGATFSGGKASYPTVGAYIQIERQRRSLFSVYADPAGPGAARVSLNFGSWRYALTDEALASLAHDLEQQPLLRAATAAARAKDFKAFPALPVDAVLAQPGVVDHLAAAWDRHLLAAGASSDGLADV
jgi:hypothetical protein